MFRITNLMPVYEQDGTILEYRISVDNGSTDGNSVSANLVIGADEINITAIAEVCKQKLRETVEQSGLASTGLHQVFTQLLNIKENNK